MCKPSNPTSVCRRSLVASPDTKFPVALIQISHQAIKRIEQSTLVVFRLAYVWKSKWEKISADMVLDVLTVPAIWYWQCFLHQLIVAASTFRIPMIGHPTDTAELISGTLFSIYNERHMPSFKNNGQKECWYTNYFCTECGSFFNSSTVCLPFFAKFALIRAERFNEPRF